MIIEAIVIVMIAALVIADSGGTTRRPDVLLAVRRAEPGRAVPVGFLGLSTEYDAVERYAGADPSAVNPIVVQLIRNLAPGQAPVLRIGGDSTDRTWWPVPGVTTPPWVKFTLDHRWLAVARALGAALQARLILGINLEADSTTIASAEANALLAGIGRSYVRALEPGNEPELYGSFGWYRAPDGTRVTGRPHGYDYPAFAGDFASVASALPGVPLAGPSFGNLVWTPHLGTFLSGQPRVGLATLHRYPLQKCFVRPGSARYPSIHNLLAPASSAGLADRFAPIAAVAHAHHMPFRIDELNTVSCGAVPAVSGSFAAALWAPDVLFELLHGGVDGVNVHTFPRAGYEMFSFTRAGGRWRVSVSPEYYGLLLFARAAPAGSRLLDVTGPAPTALKTWATLARDGSVRVLVINKDLRRSHVVGIRIPGRAGSASLMRLQAPSAAAAAGVTLGGASFGASSDSGSLAVQPASIGPSGGRYRFSVPAASAALLTVHGAR